MRANKQFFITRIDKKLRNDKQEKTESGIYLPTQFLYMKYNLQWGIITSIGEDAEKKYPDANIGDILVFSHTVESQDWRVLTDNEDEEYRVVDTTTESEVIAIIKDGNWFVDRFYVLLEQKQERVFMTAPSSSILFADAELFESDEYLLRKIEELKVQREHLNDTVSSEINPYKFEEKYNLQVKLANEGAALTKYLHRTKLVKCRVMHSNKDEVEIKHGDYVFMDNKLLYELNLEALGYKFYCVPAEFIDGIIE